MDVKALAISDYVESTEYITYLYYYDGYLRELHTAADNDLGSSILSAGQKITKLNSVSFTTDDNGLIKAVLVYNDNTDATLLLNTY